MPAGPGHSPQSHTPKPSHWVPKPSLGLGEDRASEHSGTLKGSLSKRCLAVGQAGRSSHSHLPVCSSPHKGPETPELGFLVPYVPTAGGKPPAGWPGLAGAAACCSPSGILLSPATKKAGPVTPNSPDGVKWRHTCSLPLLKAEGGCRVVSALGNLATHTPSQLYQMMGGVGAGQSLVYLCLWMEFYGLTERSF